jgi:hypothetical protein
MNAIEHFRPTKTLAILDKPLVPISAALLTANRLREKYSGTVECALRHRQCYVAAAIKVRTEERLREFLEADVAASMLFLASNEKLQRPTAVAMVTALYHALGMRLGDETAGLLEGSLDMFEVDEIGRASGLWEPLKVTPATLSLACRKLITTAIYPPKPAELRAACKEAGDNLLWAYQAADELRDSVRKADAVLLHFAPHEEWERPYLTPRLRPALARMLELHDAYGDETPEAWDDDNEFRALVEAEQAKLAIAEPLVPEAAPVKKLVASRKHMAIKRSKPKQ